MFFSIIYRHATLRTNLIIFFISSLYSLPLSTHCYCTHSFEMGICSSCKSKNTEKSEDYRPSSPIQSGVINLEKKSVRKERSVSFKGESKEQIASRLLIKKAVERNVSILSKKSLVIPEENRSRAPTIVVNEALDDGDEIARDL